MTAHDYWMALSDQLGEQKCLPIWQWSIFENPEDARGEMDSIREILNYHFIRSQFSDNVAVLFLIHCALKMRLDLLWSDNISSYRDEIFKDVVWSQNRWSDLIEKGEKVLGRTPLDTQNRYEARVKIEAGIPLWSICSGTEGTIWRNLKRIWNRIDLSDTVLGRWVEEEYETNQSIEHQNTLPGGDGAGFYFLKYGVDILRDVDEDNISESLERRHHFYPDTQRFKLFLIGNGGGRNRENELNWRKIIRINRVLRLTGSPTLYTHFILKEDSSRLVRDITLKCSNKESVICYDNGQFAPKVNPHGYFDSLEPVDADICYQIKGEYCHIKQRFLDELVSDVMLFTPLYRDGVLKENYYTHLERPPKSLESHRENFPLVAAISDDFQNSNTLNVSDFFIGNINIKGLGNYSLYKFDEFRDYNSSGLNKCPTELKLEPPRQHFDVFLNGRKIRKISSGWPISPILSSKLLQKNGEQWEDAPSYKRVDNIRLSSFKINSDKNENGTEIAVFPKYFSYKYNYNTQKRCFDGITLYKIANSDTIAPTEVRINGEIANELSWQSLNHDSIIECDVRTNGDKILTIRIPSPIEGVSWLFESGNAPDGEGRYKKIPLRESKKTFLHYEAAQGNQTILPDRVHWIISLIVGNECVLQRDDVQDISNRYRDRTLFLELPDYLEILFSSTNSLEAKIKIEAHLLLDGEPNNYRASIDSRRTSLIVSRFDERNPPVDTSYFYFGLLNPQDHCTSLNAIPNQEELSKDYWIKVPAIALSDNRIVWDGVHRIRSFENNTINASGLQGLQAILMGGYSETIEGLRIYFKSNDLSNEDVCFIDNYINFCYNHEIPLCNLWLLQVVLECDWIACQIPSAVGLMNKSNYKFAFDRRLLRPEIVARYSKNFENEQNIIGLHEEPEDEIDENAISSFDLNLNTERWKSMTGTFVNLGRQYGEFFQETEWNDVEEWKKIVCYIVENVILTPKNDNQRHQQHYQQALYVLRLLETVDKRSVALLLQKIVKWKYEGNIKSEFESNAKSISRELDIYIDDKINSYNGEYGNSLVEAQMRGCNFALDECFKSFDYLQIINYLESKQMSNDSYEKLNELIKQRLDYWIQKKEIEDAFKKSVIITLDELQINPDKRFYSYAGEYGTSLEDAEKNGRNFVLNECWKIIAFGCFKRYDLPSVPLKPQECDDCESFKNAIKSIINEGLPNLANGVKVLSDDVEKFIVNLENEIKSQKLTFLDSVPGCAQWKKDFSVITHGLMLDADDIRNSFDVLNSDYVYNDEEKRKCHIRALKILLNQKLERHKLVKFTKQLENVVDCDEGLPYQENDLDPNIDFLVDWVKRNQIKIRQCFENTQWWHNHCIAFPKDRENGFPLVLLK